MTEIVGCLCFVWQDVLVDLKHVQNIEFGLEWLIQCLIIYWH
jgi:hypothetical protein